MGLADTIARAVGAGFSALGNIVVSARYDSYVTANRNIATGYSSIVARRYHVGGVFSRFKHDETLIGAEINPATDRKFTLLQTRLPVAPSVRDNIHLYELGIEVVWDVVGYGQDPVNATWILALRRRKG